MEAAKTQGRVELAFMVDGADITKKSTHITGGFKLIDW